MNALPPLRCSTAAAPVEHFEVSFDDVVVAPPRADPARSVRVRGFERHTGPWLALPVVEADPITYAAWLYAFAQRSAARLHEVDEEFGEDGRWLMAVADCELPSPCGMTWKVIVPSGVNVMAPDTSSIELYFFDGLRLEPKSALAPVHVGWRTRP